MIHVPSPPTREDAEALALDERLFGFYVVDSETGARIDPLTARVGERRGSAVLALPFEIREADYLNAWRRIHEPALSFIGRAANEGTS